ncbi:TMEM1 family protein-like protein [Calycina marina]|uniref:TMEM1 family protein-like protein n=1 Tax=Calycina marina TaxID=1763456 RepID=A0A9P7YZP1_9HELO|nr:TMEM1 family protein-like protein [Calycina marina]
MEQPSSSSKVAVEYFDPYGVFPLLSPGLLARLPLQNLHWESHSGPLRSISSLYIDLISSEQTSNPSSAVDATPTRPDYRGVKSENSAIGGDDGFRTQNLGKIAGENAEEQTGLPKSATKSRRHQIPGLRQTPYLKVFLLRCDDNDAYKATARRDVREWIKEYTPPTTSTAKLNAQENHDAYEWLVLHVIVPNTAAATQPRSISRVESGSGASTDKTAAARWRGGGSQTILDKLRADFNSSSRLATDHCAQIRIGVNDVPYEMLPRVVPAIPGSYTETPQENESAWADLILKFKELILASFDMRVGQYEEDIRERDAQRALPGWNFCTFFVLKEGLARGFESVGLVEDALVGYDELSVGLDSIIREQSLEGSGPEHGGSFLPYTEELKVVVDRAKAAVLRDAGAESDAAEQTINLQAGEDDVDEIALNAAKKRYRELILANNISVFDFRCYVFARQLSLLLRLANAWSSQEELLTKLKEQRESSLRGLASRFPASPASDDPENLTVLSEICKRSMDFIASISSIARDDLWATQGYSPHGENEEPPRERDLSLIHIIDNIVSSFTFSVAQQILAQTSTNALPIPPTFLAPPSSKLGTDGQEPKVAIPEPKTMMHPARSSSLAVRSRSGEPSITGSFPSDRRVSSVPDQTRGVPASSTFLKAGLEELAAQRAGLYILSRNILERVGRARDWSVGWAEVAKFQYGVAADMDEIDLSYEEATKTSEDKPGFTTNSTPILHGIESRLLRVAVDSQDDYYRLYETLTDKALRHYKVASHTQSAEASMADLAVFKFHLTDYAAAASYFYQIWPSYNDGGWTQIELSMLVMYAECLKQLQQKERYVRVVLILLSKAAAAEKERNTAKSSFKFGPNHIHHEEIVPPEPYLAELLRIVKTLPQPVVVPLQSLFSQVEVQGSLRYHPSQDSFALQLQLRYLLSEAFTIDKVKVRMTAVAGDTSKEIWLENDEPLLCKQGNVKVLVQSNSTISATYAVTYISLHASNMVLKYEHGATGHTASQDSLFLKCPRLLVYQQSDAFDIKLFAAKYMHLARNHSLEIELSSGWNDVLNGKLYIRPATAGLRLQTSEAKVVSGSLDLSRTSEVSVIRFNKFGTGSFVKIRIPFNLEHDVDDIALKLEIAYTTDKGDFFFAASPCMSVVLPLGVNVQDVFKHKAVFSRFTITSATSRPLRLLSTKLEDSEVFHAECGTGITRPVMIYPRQSASMLYKITKSNLQTISSPRTPGRTKSSLALVLHYVVLQEEIDNSVMQSLKEALGDIPLRSYVRLVVPTVLAELRTRMTTYDIERIAVLSEVSTEALSHVQWKEHFNGLGRTDDSDEDIPTLLDDRVQLWQQENPRIPLLPIVLDEATIESSRTIFIPVEIPSVTAVHTADIKILGDALKSGVVPHSQPIPASLTINWTKIWDTKAQQEQLATLPRIEHIDFVYELSAPADMWLIGGQRKGHFRLPGDQMESKGTLSFPLVLIPVREGFLPYPSLEIQPSFITKVIQSKSPRSPAEAPVEETAVTCETDYKNAGETIRVISDAVKTTVSLDASGPQGGAMLLESHRRYVNQQVST